MAGCCARSLVAAALAALLVPCAAGAGEPNDVRRARAARLTAQNHALCSTTILKSFYWEIGDAQGVLASGRVGGRVRADSRMNVGSASKWLYGALVVERFGLSARAIPYLNFTSGFSNFDSTQCPDAGTVGDCQPGPLNEEEAARAVFHYDGGHLQRHAMLSGLGPLDNGGLTRVLRSALGDDIELSYTKPQPAGGANTDAVNYAKFLRRLLVDSPQPLQLGALLGQFATCTMPGPDCNASAAVALPEAWHYSLAHWVEDDPVTTPPINRAYSSPGLFGFYPWVDTERRLYGILARNGLDIENEAYNSARCGRLIRLAWKTGEPQVAP